MRTVRVELLNLIYICAVGDMLGHLALISGVRMEKKLTSSASPRLRELTSERDSLLKANRNATSVDAARAETSGNIRL